MTIRMVLLFALLFCSPLSWSGQSPQKEGKLVVRVLLGENNTPSRDAFVYVRGDHGTSTPVSPIKTGWFEISLAPGIYDIFVSELSSLPLCKRVEIKANHTKVYTAKPELDEEHLDQ